MYDEKKVQEELNLIKFDNLILRTKCNKINKFPVNSNIIQQMFDLMESKKGVGLAAPQVGISDSFFVVAQLSEKPHTRIFCNPIIVKYGLKTCTIEEMCLSLPGISGLVTRPKNIVIEYQNENGEKFKSSFSGVFSRIIQHEIDHLNGILFIDKISS